MSEVEEAILQSQQNQIKREEANSEYVKEDEFGIVLKCPIREMPDWALGEYMAYRARIRNKSPLLYYDPYNKAVRQGERELSRDKETMQVLAGISCSRSGAIAFAWEALLRDMPKLDKSKLVVFGGLLFDRDTGALIKTDGKELTI